MERESTGRESTGRPRQPAPRTGGRPAPRQAPRRPSRRTFVVRWVLVLVLLAAVVFGVVVGVKAIAGWVGGLFDSEEAGPATPDPTPTETGPYVPVDCTPADVQLALTADRTAFAPGSTAAFQVSIVHAGVNPCTIDAGLASRELVITSGADRIWSSADCDSVGSRMLLLAPGNQDVETVPWATQRSAPGCTPDLPAPGAGTYQAVVTAPGLTSAPLVFTVG